MVGTRSLRLPEIAGVQLPHGSALVGGGLALLAGIGATLGILLSSPLIALTMPLAAAGALICGRWPAGAMFVAFLLLGFPGTIAAFIPIIPAGFLADAIIGSLWLAVLWAYVSRPRVRRLILWSGLLAFLVYIVITAFTVPLSPNLGAALSSFHLSTWYMLLVPLIAFAHWGRVTRIRIARSLIVVGILVGCYAVFRYLAGASGAETEVSRAAQPGIPNSIPLRFSGSFRIPSDLSGWAAVMLPLGTAAFLAWTGRWRYAALTMVGLLAFALLASGTRVGMVGALVGVPLTIGLFLLARAFPVGHRLTAGVVSVVVLFAIGTGGYAVVTTGSPEKVERLEAVFDPTSAYTYRLRLERWKGAWDAIEKEPFGYGLGRSGGAAVKRADVLYVGPPSLDNSYLKVGIDQGLPGMIFYIAALTTLLLGLMVRTVRTTDPARAMFGIAACGSLSVMMVLFYAGMYFESAPVVLPGWAIVGLGAAGFTSFSVTPRRHRLAAARTRVGSAAGQA